MTNSPEVFVLLCLFQDGDCYMQHQYLGVFTSLDDAKTAVRPQDFKHAYDVVIARAKLNSLEKNEEKWDVVWRMSGKSLISFPLAFDFGGDDRRV